MFKASYRKNIETMLADLAKDDTFVKQSQELGQCYGPSLWKRADHCSSQYGGKLPTPDELRWDRDQET
jgi:hypothetical protein